MRQDLGILRHAHDNSPSSCTGPVSVGHPECLGLSSSPRRNEPKGIHFPQPLLTPDASTALSSIDVFTIVRHDGLDI